MNAKSRRKLTTPTILRPSLLVNYRIFRKTIVLLRPLDSAERLVFLSEVRELPKRYGAVEVIRHR